MQIISQIFKQLVILFVCFFPFSNAYSFHISGKITDLKGHALPFASIYIKNSTYGVSSNSFGEYFMEIEDGEYTFIYSSIGYISKEISVIINAESKVINVSLKEDNKQLIELEIVSNTKNKALEILKKAKETKKQYYQKSYKCIQYSKNSIEKRQYKLKRKDTIKIWDLDTSKTINLKNDVLKFIETYGEFYNITNNKKYWDFEAYHDFADTRPKDDYVIIQSFEEFGEYNITPEYKIRDEYESLMNYIELELDLYKNNIELEITNNPIISPLSPSSRTYYKYDYQGFIIENNSNKIHKIRITPRFKNDPLLNGILFIEDSSYIIKSFEFEITGPKQSDFKIEKFHVIQNYKWIENQNVMNRKIIDFTIKDQEYKILGNAITINKDFEFDKPIPEKFKKNQIKYFNDSTEKISNKQWESYRAIDLKENEIKYIKYTDSLRNYYTSEEYLLEKDSSYNKVTLSRVFWEGIGRKNRFKGRSFYIWPVVSQFNFFGIGGYRHTLGFHYNQNIKGKYKISTKNMIDYGIVNEDVKGSTNVSIISDNKKYRQVTIGIGDQYKVINRYPSFTTAISRTNYVRSKHIETGYRTELLNGLYGEIKFLYCFQNPINNLNLEEDLINQTYQEDTTLNLEIPVFEPYKKTETRIQLTWLPFQKYYYKKNRKIVLGTDFPTFNFIYRKGIPKLFNSEVNFDYLEIGANHKFKIPHLGESKWNFQLGSFINDKNLRLIEWKFFRGSDPFIFSNPLTSFQLLGPTINTNGSFLRGNYVHNFNGNILNKIPLLNKMKLQLSTGAASIVVPNEKLNHIEIFAGISRPFRIFGGLVKFGIYLSGSINSSEGTKIEPKIGANGYSSFTNSWDY